MPLPPAATRCFLDQASLREVMNPEVRERQSKRMIRRKAGAQSYESNPSSEHYPAHSSPPSRDREESTNTQEFVLLLVQSKDTIVIESIAAWQTLQRAS